VISVISVQLSKTVCGRVPDTYLQIAKPPAFVFWSCRESLRAKPLRSGKTFSQPLTVHTYDGEFRHYALGCYRVQQRFATQYFNDSFHAVGEQTDLKGVGRNILHGLIFSRVEASTNHGTIQSLPGEKFYPTGSYT
jgi:hypothetical protein